MKKLGFGMMRLPLKDKDDQTSIDMSLTRKMVDEFIKSGFIYFDTAYPYHNGASEIAFRELVAKRYPRESFLLADKMPVWDIKCVDNFERIFSEQLERCGVKYFDYYLLHCLTTTNYAINETYKGFDFAKKIKQDSRANHIGFSFHDKAVLLDEILTEHPETEFVQLQINYIDWDDESVEGRKCYDVAKKHNKPVIIMEPVKGGALANVKNEVKELFTDYNPNASVASWAVRFAASLDNAFMVLSGMSDMEQMLDNISYMKDLKPLNDEEYHIIGEAIKLIKNDNTIPCTECKYCVNECPQNIAIPEYFSIFNSVTQFGMSVPNELYFKNLKKRYGAPEDCIGCKQCEKHCPQHINITKMLCEITQMFTSKE